MAPNPARSVQEDEHEPAGARGRPARASDGRRCCPGPGTLRPEAGGRPRGHRPAGLAADFWWPPQRDRTCPPFETTALWYLAVAALGKPEKATELAPESGQQEPG